MTDLQQNLLRWIQALGIMLAVMQVGIIDESELAKVRKLVRKQRIER